MMVFQCPDCLGVHEETTEPLVGIFVRCEMCLLDAELTAERLTSEAPFETEFLPAQAA